MHEASEMRVIVVGNYPDLMQSMRRYADLLETCAHNNGFECIRIAPTPVFGKRFGSWNRGLGKWLAHIDKYILFPRRIRKIASRERLKHTRLVAHISDHGNAMYAKHLKDMPVIITCHDCMNILQAKGMAEAGTKSITGKIQQNWILRSLSKTDCVIACSGQTAEDLSVLLGNPLETFQVIHPALNRSFRKLSKPNAEQSFIGMENILLAAKENRLVFHLGSNAWYKNRDGVIRMFHQLQKIHSSRNWHLVLAGPRLTPQLVRLTEELLDPSSYSILVHPADSVVEALYNLATVFVFPSKKEGFGWPIVEAQACGCLVAAIDADPMREVMGDAGIKLPHPDTFPSPEQWAVKAAQELAQQLSLPPEQLDAIRALGLSNTQRFSPEVMARHLGGLYRRVSDEHYD